MGAWFGGVLTPSVELGVRHDGGMSRAGRGWTLGGRVRYRDGARGLTVEGGARALVGHGGEQEEWGVDGVVRMDPGASGRGWSVSVRPSWGEASDGGVLRRWDDERTVLVSSGGEASGMRFDAEVGYGVGAASGRGVWTPYGGMSLDGEDRRSVRLGGRFELGSSLELSFEGERVEGGGTVGEPEHGVMLRGRWRF